MKIMVFLHGTVIMHKSGLGASREQRVQQGKNKEASVYDYVNYVPIGKANEKIKKWKEQSAKIVYLSSHETDGDVKKDIISLSNYDFPDAPVLYRHCKDTYVDVAERVMPDILIEDDCESIGGEIEMTYPHISPSKRRLIKSIVVKEFEGIDHLPDDINQLKLFD